MSLKTALITGAGSGIGQTIAETFAQQGMNIVIADINLPNAKATADAINQQHKDCAIAIEVDVTNETMVQTCIKETVATFGRLDILVNNAGIQVISPLVEFEYDQWRKVIDIHLNGMFLMSKYAMTQMRSQSPEGGNIVFVGSVHSFEASVNKSAYVSAKHAALGMVRSIAKEGANNQIRANLVAPGFVRTPLVDKQIPEQAKALNLSEEQVIQNVMLKNTADGEFTTSQQVAQAVLFFANADHNAFTGQSLIVSHGWHMD